MKESSETTFYKIEKQYTTNSLKKKGDVIIPSGSAAGGQSNDPLMKTRDNILSSVTSADLDTDALHITAQEIAELNYAQRQKTQNL